MPCFKSLVEKHPAPMPLLPFLSCEQIKRCRFTAALPHSSLRERKEGGHVSLVASFSSSPSFPLKTVAALSPLNGSIAAPLGVKEGGAGEHALLLWRKKGPPGCCSVQRMMVPFLRIRLGRGRFTRRVPGAPGAHEAPCCRHRGHHPYRRDHRGHRHGLHGPRRPCRHRSCPRPSQRR